MDFSTIDYGVLIPAMLQGMLVSLEIFFLTLLFALPLGLLVALGRGSKNKVVSLIVGIYVQIMRGTPLMLQLFFFCYGPYFIFGISDTDRFVAAIVGFSLNYAAYFAEIYRGGIESVPIGQYEAAGALGFTKAQTFKKIVLPQVIKKILPPMSNEFMTLVKDTSLAQVIAIIELFTMAQKFSNSWFSTVPLVVAGVFYLIMNTLVGQGFKFAEKKLSYYR